MNKKLAKEYADYMRGLKIKKILAENLSQRNFNKVTSADLLMAYRTLCGADVFYMPDGFFALVDEIADEIMVRMIEGIHRKDNGRVPSAKEESEFYKAKYDGIINRFNAVSNQCRKTDVGKQFTDLIYKAKVITRNEGRALDNDIVRTRMYKMEYEYRRDFIEFCRVLFDKIDRPDED